MTREQLKKLAIDIKEVTMDMNKKVTYIISSDFTHYGSNYGYIPFESERQKNIYALDNKAIEFIKNFDAKGFLNFVEQERITICGANPIYLLLNLIKDANVLLEQYYTSADLDPDSNYRNSVSYASIVFNEK